MGFLASTSSTKRSASRLTDSRMIEAPQVNDAPPSRPPRDTARCTPLSAIRFRRKRSQNVARASCETKSIPPFCARNRRFAQEGQELRVRIQTRSRLHGAQPGRMLQRGISQRYRVTVHGVARSPLEKPRLTPWSFPPLRVRAHQLQRWKKRFPASGTFLHNRSISSIYVTRSTGLRGTRLLERPRERRSEA
jgi:hypothetical protein